MSSFSLAFNSQYVFIHTNGARDGGFWAQYEGLVKVLIKLTTRGALENKPQSLDVSGIFAS